MIKLIVALGNPGREYSETRHNIGWMLADEVVGSSAAWKNKFKGQYLATTLAGQSIYILKPETYMNLSGESVQALCSFFKIQISEILVLHDELDLPYGQTHFKKGGGLAGHNGLKSITQCMGSQEFMRMRIGIGRPPHGNVSSWVLSKFDGDEAIALSLYLKELSKALQVCLKQDLQRAANQYNKKQLI